MADVKNVMGVSADDIKSIMGVSKDDIEKVMGVEIPASGPTWAGTRAVYAGGTEVSLADLDRIQYKTVGASANTVDFGDLQTNRAMSQCTGSNSSRGIFGGGATRSGDTIDYGVTDMDYITIASTGDGTDFGDMAQEGSYAANGGSSNGTLLFSNGGYNDDGGNVYLNNIEYVTIASTGNGTDAGDLNATLSNLTGSNGNSRYLVAGGYEPVSSGFYKNEIRYNDFSTSADSSDFGDLSNVSINGHSMSSELRSILSRPLAAETDLITLEYVTVASTGNSSDFGDLSTGRKNVAGTTNGTTGESGGGSNSSSVELNIIDIVTIASTGDATDIGDLLEAAEHVGATSG